MSDPPGIRISDDGREFTLDYTGLLAYHGGGAVAGAAVGFRVMQAAAAALAGTEPWERNRVTVVSGHPGPGYRDAFEYVTRCVSRDRFRVDRDLPGGRHSPFQHYAFQFLADDRVARMRATITLHAGVLPLRLFEVLRDLGKRADDSMLCHELETLKQAIADDVLCRTTGELFDIDLATLH